MSGTGRQSVGTNSFAQQLIIYDLWFTVYVRSKDKTKDKGLRITFYVRSKTRPLTLALSPLGRGDVKYGRVRTAAARILVAGFKKADTWREGVGLFSFVIIK